MSPLSQSKSNISPILGETQRMIITSGNKGNHNHTNSHSHITQYINKDNQNDLYRNTSSGHSTNTSSFGLLTNGQIVAGNNHIKLNCGINKKGGNINDKSNNKRNLFYYNYSTSNNNVLKCSTSSSFSQNNNNQQEVFSNDGVSSISGCSEIIKHESVNEIPFSNTDEQEREINTNSEQPPFENINDDYYNARYYGDNQSNSESYEWIRESHQQQLPRNNHTKTEEIINDINLYDPNKEDNVCSQLTMNNLIIKNMINI
jgi:hypothetical protein